MTYTFEEAISVLGSDHVDTELTYSVVPYVIWNEIYLGVLVNKVFRQVVLETNILEGGAGYKLRIPYVGTRFTDSDILTLTEDQMDTSGMALKKITPASIEISAADIFYICVGVTDVLKEDSGLDWAAPQFRAMGEALAEKIEVVIKDLLVAGVDAGNIVTSAGTLTYDNVADAIGKLEAANWVPELPPFLILHPSAKIKLVKETKSSFYQLGRFEGADIPFKEGQGQLYAGCRVLTTTKIPTYLALVVSDPKHRYGPSTVFAWKRSPKTETWREELKQRTLTSLTARFAGAVLFGKAIAMISNC